MKKIEIDDELYQYIASNTQSIGESASEILRRLLKLTPETESKPVAQQEEKQVQEIAAESQTKTPSQPVKPAANVFNILNKEELAMQKGVVGRFLFILSALHRTHKSEFNSVLEIKGRDRIYFATSKNALLESGSSMNPKNIADSEYWVMTNSNTTRKKMMLHEVAKVLGYTDEAAEKIRDYL
ncbi:replication initiation negative regulator SeqA [Pseudoalteromonas piscicida]|uniref:Negative modulator of initiation of replication n=1 Tax=Pseudoalteromonas piscicida TaxID=43662 RepID=A0AAQ2ISA7_PSEO7|nr:MULTISPECIES: replication initiation negative regulator SeqA [Pseudoalteromonas]KJY89192.1 N-carbamyl-L-amino acid amidohydrolase [Pseudoalteromonas piscicida]TMN35189.1 replication initiation negative regulator SeqA [Pseudoalteromonas piscicida]TMN43331.1 replication initiation negative regulator SeqA [Pseudoalteromonas piscicida]TMN51836.1 replication initiation negative regulator SeqA [Pseudoalteromonas piscicida]TMN52643.1 replication initiation negative regulator SeqA [Pseudoalteromona